MGIHNISVCNALLREIEHLVEESQMQSHGNAENSMDQRTATAFI